MHLYSAITQDTSNTFSGGSDDNAPQVEGARGESRQCPLAAIIGDATGGGGQHCCRV